MSTLIGRIVNVARSYLHRDIQEEDGYAGDSRGGESRAGSRPDGFQTEHGKGSRRASTGEPGAHHGPGGTPEQVVEDLAVFDLSPPGSLEAVKSARNREMKKYHSDKFLNDPDRLKTSKEIMQIYNAAYDRLYAHYQKAAKRGATRT